KHLIKVLLVGMVLSLTASTAFAWENDLEQAIAKSKASGKMLFIMFGREACGNCQHLKKMIKSGAVDIKINKFVIADINCDNKKQSAVFYKRYSVSGNMLPFVVIAKPDGTMINSRTGYAEAAEYNKLIKDANK
ncbi:MAG: thioredoxin family protein, partial [Dehalococcoidales bacterium]